MTWIQTFSGFVVDLLDPDPNTIFIPDIAHALARLCRYSGHTQQHYSVAQHSVLVAKYLPRDLAMEGLFHDAAEAYVQDVSSPMKIAMREISEAGSPYDRIEYLVDMAIASRLGLRRPLHPLVKEADLRALATEYRDLGFEERAVRQWKIKAEPVNWPISRCWPAEEAENRFLETLQEIST